MPGTNFFMGTARTIAQVCRRVKLLDQVARFAMFYLEGVYQEIVAFSRLTPWPPLPRVKRGGEGEKSLVPYSKLPSPRREALGRGVGGEVRIAGNSW